MTGIPVRVVGVNKDADWGFELVFNESDGGGGWDYRKFELVNRARHTDADLAMALDLAVLCGLGEAYDDWWDIAELQRWLREEVRNALLERAS
jgi:hypothetical protein